MRRAIFLLIIILTLLIILGLVYFYVSSNNKLLWRLHFKPSPQLSTSNKDYQSHDLSKFYKKEIVQSFAKEYKADKRSNLKEDATEFLGNMNKKTEIPKERFIEFLDYVNPETDKIYMVPVYVEKAKFENQDSLIIVQVAGRPGGKLNQAKIWIVRIRDGMLLLATSSGNIIGN